MTYHNDAVFAGGHQQAQGAGVLAPGSAACWHGRTATSAALHAQCQQQQMLVTNTATVSATPAPGLLHAGHVSSSYSAQPMTMSYAAPQAPQLPGFSFPPTVMRSVPMFQPQAGYMMTAASYGIQPQSVFMTSPMMPAVQPMQTHIMAGMGMQVPVMGSSFVPAQPCAGGMMHFDSTRAVHAYNTMHQHAPQQMHSQIATAPLFVPAQPPLMPQPQFLPQQQQMCVDLPTMQQQMLQHRMTSQPDQMLSEYLVQQ
jgi:hypothetical protein